MRNYKYLFWDGYGDTFYFSDLQKEFYYNLAPTGKRKKHNTAGLSTIAELIEEVQKKNSQYKFFISKDFENLT
jgi:molybdopterin/thiamine biosynthesis adenylyltransferase